ncbi:MAG: DUF1572 domain-containing protein [Rhodothermales bacterium]
MDATLYLAHIRRQFRKQRSLADRALAQIAQEDWFIELGPRTNSLAIIMKHMAGNMRSRWRDFLTSDGEKSDRHRDTEFELLGDDAEAIQAKWEQGWQILFDTLDALAPGDMMATITIRGEQHYVFEAIQRQIDHYAYHTGQIVLLARHLAGDDWQSLSIPKGESQAFNAAPKTYRD